jgi:hypothetical protein
MDTPLFNLSMGTVSLASILFFLKLVREFYERWKGSERPTPVTMPGLPIEDIKKAISKIDDIHDNYYGGPNSYELKKSVEQTADMHKVYSVNAEEKLIHVIGRLSDSIDTITKLTNKFVSTITGIEKTVGAVENTLISMEKYAVRRDEKIDQLEKEAEKHDKKLDRAIELMQGIKGVG